MDSSALVADTAAILKNLADVSENWGKSARDGDNANLQRFLTLAADGQIRNSPCELSYRSATWKLFDAANRALEQLSPRMAKTLEGDYLIVANHLRDLGRPTGDDERDFALWGPVHFARTCRDFAKVLAKGDGEKPYAFSPDYRCAHWYGQEYSFSPTQALLVQVLYEAYEAKTPDVDAAILVGKDAFTQQMRQNKGKKPSAAKRVRDIFRGSPAWGRMIVPGGTKGTYRLKEPQVPCPSQ